MSQHGTGYAWKHPSALPAATDPRNWKFRHLLDGTGTTVVPYQQLPDFDYDLGPVLDQGSSPACTRFAVTGIRNWQELQDGAPAAPFTSAEALQSYQYLKSGDPTHTWPGDGIPYASGDIPINVWRYEQLVGSTDPSGKNHVIAAYYQLDKTSAQTQQQWLDEFFAVLQAFGPISVSSAWPTNWFAFPSNGVMPTPGGAQDGHMWAVKGKRTLSDGTIVAVCRQSWGSSWGLTDSFGQGGEFLIPVSYFQYTQQLGLSECWKTVDAKTTGEWPTPPAPPEPNMTTPLSGSPSLVDLKIGVQCFQRGDGKTPLVAIKSGGADVFSPGAFDTAGTQLVVRISTGGVLQEAVVNASDATNKRPVYTIAQVK